MMEQDFAILYIINLMLEWCTHFCQRAESGDILILFTPTRLAYLTSPLDNDFFSTFKLKWREYISDLGRTPSQQEKNLKSFEIVRQMRDSDVMACYKKNLYPPFIGYPSYFRADMTKIWPWEDEQP